MFIVVISVKSNSIPPPFYLTSTWSNLSLVSVELTYVAEPEEYVLQAIKLHVTLRSCSTQHTLCHLDDAYVYALLCTVAACLMQVGWQLSCVLLLYTCVVGTAALYCALYNLVSADNLLLDY